MIGRTGELAGHAWSRSAELEEAALRAYAQTAELAHAHPGQVTYALVPDEARPMIQAALDRKNPREAAELELPLADRCLVPFDLVDIEARLICLLPAGHDSGFRTIDSTPEHGWYRFVDARERGAIYADEAADRVADRFANARKALRYGPDLGRAWMEQPGELE